MGIVVKTALWRKYLKYLTEDGMALSRPVSFSASYKELTPGVLRSNLRNLGKTEQDFKDWKESKGK